MKKLIFIILLFVPFLMMAQTLTSPKAITTDQDYYYLYGDTLEKDAAISQYYYVKDFCQDIRIQSQVDTLAAGYLKIRTIVYGSLDYSNWYTLDTLDIAGQTSATGSLLEKDVYSKYLKLTTTAIDSTQYGEFKYRILFNTNK